MCVKQCQPMPTQRKRKIQMRSADSKTQKFQLAYNSCSGISGVLSFLIRMYYDMTNRFGSGTRLQDSIGAANSWMHRKVPENHFWRWVLDVLGCIRWKVLQTIRILNIHSEIVVFCPGPSIAFGVMWFSRPGMNKCTGASGAVDTWKERISHKPWTDWRCNTM